MNGKFKLYGGLIALLVTGIIIGSLGTGIYIRNKVMPFYEGGPAERRSMILDRLMKKLDLTPQQQIEVEAILRQTQAQIKQLKHKSRLRAMRIINQRFPLIREKLNPEQQKKLDRIHKRLRQRMRQHMEMGGDSPMRKNRRPQ